MPLSKNFKNNSVSTAAMIHAYRSRVMELNGISADVQGRFNVVPEIEQKLEARIREQADFLGQINVIGVRDLEGDKVGLDVSGPIASRTNTDNNDRATTDNTNLDDRRYRCEKTNFDTHIPWAKLDTWSRQPNFQKLISDGVTKQIARDRLMIGFNGTTAAAQTDLNANPLLQDVNIGWLHHIATDKPAATLIDVKVGTQSGSDFKNVDAAIYAARHELIAPWNRNATDLVAITGSGVIVDKNLSLMQAHDEPTERAALQTLISNQMIGTLKPEFVPYFPEKSVLITSYKNLSIYFQEGSRRRHIKDNPKRDRLEDFQSVNEAYVVEDLDKCAFVSILQYNAGTSAWE